MKKIPLHSLVLIFQETNSDFPENEMLSFEKVKNDLVGNIQRKDIFFDILNELKRRISIKLSLGERSVVILKSSEIYFRKQIAKIADELDIPVFYIFDSSNLGKKENNIDSTDILVGDHIAEVIDLHRSGYQITKDFHSDPDILIEEIKSLGYIGITIIPDIHGCYEALLNAINWAKTRNHFIIFLGDIIDYGPKPIECVLEVHRITSRGEGLFILGNHEIKIWKWLSKHRVRLNHGNLITIEKINKLSDSNFKKFEPKFRFLIGYGRNHCILNNYMFVHAGAYPEMWNIHKKKLDDKNELISLYGEINKTNQENNNIEPVRTYQWVNTIPHNKTVLVGHDIRSKISPFIETNEIGGKAIFLDTGLGKGGILTTADMRFEDFDLKIANFKQN